ncbi:MAG: TonB-dependent receptor, partial [Alphaproteobacteria bacterium]|nr:TonB-dependent receptor [Alphaproteobacteria bacterium]
MKAILFSSAACIALATPALAQSQLTYPHLDDENMAVSATRIPTPASNIASSVTVITAAQIEQRQDRSLPDVLREVPGLDIVQTGEEGGQTSIFMRGSNSNHTKVLVDGIDIADPSTPNGAADISKFLAGDIARVEVLRGPQGALYGSDAIGGVINITTQSGNGPLTFHGSVEGGSFETSNQIGTLSGSTGDFHYRATLQYFHSGAAPVTPLNLLPAGVARNDDAYDNVTASTKLGYDVAENFDLGLTGHYYNSLGRITGDSFNLVTFASSPAATQTRISSIQYQTRGTAHWVLGDGRLDQTLGLAYGSNIIATQDPNNGNGRTSGDRVKLDWQGNVRLAEGETLVLGAETARDALHRGLSFGFPTSLSQGITTNAGYAEIQTDLPIGFHNSFSVRDDGNSRFGNRATWRIAPSWVIDSSGTTLRASAGSGFKA